MRLQATDDIVLEGLANIRTIIHADDCDIAEWTRSSPGWMPRALDMGRGTGRRERKQQAGHE
jgi:hypothetical protein